MSLSTLLQSRVNELDISISDLARRSGVSRATVIRILGGKDEHYSVSNLQAVLSALGMKMNLSAIPAKRFRDSIATQKAQRLIALTQGNVALESQAVSAASAQEHLSATKARIASSSRKLWAT
jgi:transcriptional regulator with XRE-family HTH domain